jgi:hypothetical protein
LLYSGLDLEEIRALKKGDLNFEVKIVSAKSGKKVKVDDKIAELWKYCSKMIYIEGKNSRASDAMPKYDISEYSKYLLTESDYLIRPVSRNKNTNEIIPLATLRSVINNVFRSDSDDETDASDIKISPSNIRNSGIFYRLYSLESSGVEITHEVVAENFYIIYRDKSDLNIKTRKWRIDYEDWKHAFGYV